MRIFLVFSLLCVFLSIPAFAGDGLAMHGKAAQPATATHLSYADPSAPKGGSLKQGVIGTFDTLNPFALKGKSAQGLQYVYDRLMARSWDEPFTLYPLIAERALVPADRSSITFFIDKRAKFHDGTPITVDDVIFSFETLRDKGRPNMRRVYQLVSRVEKIGANGVTFALKKGYDRETVMILAMMPVLSKSFWSSRDFDKTLLSAPLGNGPYKVSAVDAGRRLTLQRVPEYWAKDLLPNKGLHNFDTLVYDYFRDDTVAFEAFKTGDLDVRIEYNPARWIQDYDFPTLKNGVMTKSDITHGRVERMWGFVFNTRRPPFDNRKVRQALGLMIDYDWINKNLFHGQYKTTRSYFDNSTLAATGTPSPKELALLKAFERELPAEVFGPAWQPPLSGTPQAARANQLQADQLLKEAGWIVQNGKRVDASGKAMTFEILLTMPEDEKVALAFKRSLEKLGITVTLRTLDNAAYRDRMMDYDFDMTLTFWQNSLSPGTEQMLYWGCQAAKEPARFNYPGICNPAVEKIAAAIPNVRNREDLAAHTRALDRILTWQYYAIPLFYSGKDTVAHRASLKRPAKTALYGNMLESWWSAPKAN